MLCVVNKPFLGAGENFVRNQLIDASIFRNAQVLITQRFIRPATESEIASADVVDPVEEEEEAVPDPAPPRRSLKLKRRKRA